MIGAGHAGLNAVKAVRKTTDRWVLINGGPLGTTCARIGCMPSKVAIHLADTYKTRDRLSRFGVSGGEGLALDERGVPAHDPQTLQVGRLPIYLAGDADGRIANLQRAAEQGRIAGHNATHRKALRYRHRTPMSIIFSEPNIAFVGSRFAELDQDKTVVATQRFGPVGRALIMGQNRGLLRVYAAHKNGRLLGAEMVGPRCEHLAHLLAWAVESRMTVSQALDMPFYHPVIEEALQDALLELRGQIERAKDDKRRFVWFRSPAPQG
ncbi:NAD(P)/FAD-dependent oxidoreductase [Halochromatium sp.]